MRSNTAIIGVGRCLPRIDQVSILIHEQTEFFRPFVYMRRPCCFPGSVPPRMARICAGSVPTLRSPRMIPGGTENTSNGSSITSPHLPLPLPRPGTQLPTPQPPPRLRSGGASDLLRRPFHHLAVYLAVGGAFATDHQHTRLRVEFQCLAHIAVCRRRQSAPPPRPIRRPRSGGRHRRRRRGWRLCGAWLIVTPIGTLCRAER